MSIVELAAWIIVLPFVAYVLLWAVIIVGGLLAMLYGAIFK